MDARTPKATLKAPLPAKPNKPRRERIELAALRQHYEGATTQLRMKRDEAVVERYVDAMQRGETFPPIEAVAVGDATFYIADGWHRAAAAERHAKLARQRGATIAANVHTPPEGVKPIDYAMRLALRANTTHGLMLTRGDQERRASIALRLPEYRGLSASALEREIGASRMTIARAHEKLVAAGELPEWQTGAPLPAWAPLEYASLHRKGTRGHPMCWDRELRAEVFAFVGQLKAFAPREWCYRFGDGADLRERDGGEGEDVVDENAADHWATGYVEHHGLVPDRVVMFEPFPPNTVTKGLPRVRRIIDPHAVLTDEQRSRVRRAMRERERQAAWQRIKGHVTRSVPGAVRTVVEHAEREPGFLEDLWRVLPPPRAPES